MVTRRIKKPCVDWIDKPYERVILNWDRGKCLCPQVFPRNLRPTQDTPQYYNESAGVDIGCGDFP